MEPDTKPRRTGNRQEDSAWWPSCASSPPPAVFCRRSAGTRRDARWNPRPAPQPGRPPASPSPVIAPVSVDAAPANGAKQVNPAAPVSVKVGNGSIESVTLTSTAGEAVEGSIVRRRHQLDRHRTAEVQHRLQLHVRGQGRRRPRNQHHPVLQHRFQHPRGGRRHLPAGRHEGRRGAAPAGHLQRTRAEPGRRGKGHQDHHQRRPGGRLPLVQRHHGPVPGRDLLGGQLHRHHGHAAIRR